MRSKERNGRNRGGAITGERRGRNGGGTGRGSAMHPPHERFPPTFQLWLRPLASTPPGMPGTHPPQYFGWGGRQREYPPQYYYVLSDIADQYWLPYVRSASSRFHSAIRRH